MYDHPAQRLYSCQICKKEGRDFSVAADQYGVAMMREHLRDKHGERWEQ